MSQDQKPPPFLDDPSFQAELAALDRGLTGPVPPDDQTVPPPTEPKSARAAPVNPVESPTPGAIFPESTLAPQAQSPTVSRLARGETRAGMPEWADAATPASGGPRPLLTLFPPPFGQRERAHSGGSGRTERQVEERGPVTAGAPPPRIVRSRLALDADAAELARTRDQPKSASASYDESVAAAVADLERVPERSDEGRIVGIVGRAIILLALMLAGAAAAAWVYWAQVSQLLSR